MPRHYIDKQLPIHILSYRYGLYDINLNEIQYMIIYPHEMGLNYIHHTYACFIGAPHVKTSACNVIQT